MLPHALKNCPNSNKSPNLVTLDSTTKAQADVKKYW